jgi:hypothetical protein
VAVVVSRIRVVVDEVVAGDEGTLEIRLREIGSGVQHGDDHVRRSLRSRPGGRCLCQRRSPLQAPERIARDLLDVVARGGEMRDHPVAPHALHSSRASETGHEDGRVPAGHADDDDVQVAQSADAARARGCERSNHGVL